MDCSGAASPVSAPARIKISTIGATGSDPFPMIDRMWEIFSGKGIRTVFLTIGNSSSSAADLDIGEALGCPIHYVPLTEKGAQEWAEVGVILKERKREESSATHPFSDGAQAKWILPKNLRALERLPWWREGSVAVGERSIQAAAAPTVLKNVCEAMKVKDNVVRLDVLKVDTRAEAPGLERALLPAILDAGFRPAIVLVAWSAQPDVELSTTMAAGHLQNCGYRLMGKLGTKFVYYFTDNDMYQICSWEDDTCTNPMVNEIARSVREIATTHNTQATAQSPSQEEKGYAPVQA